MFDLLKGFGFAAESGSFFIFAPYSKIVSLNIPFISNSLKRAIYFFPKYRFLNHVETHSLIIYEYAIYYYFMFVDFNIVFKYLKTWNHFWFYCFALDLFPVKSIKSFIAFNFKYVLFSKTFSENSSRNFFYFFKLIAKEYLISMIYRMLKQRLGISTLKKNSTNK